MLERVRVCESGGISDNVGNIVKWILFGNNVFILG